MVRLTWSNYDRKVEQFYKPQEFNMDTQNLLKEVLLCKWSYMIMLC